MTKAIIFDLDRLPREAMRAASWQVFRQTEVTGPAAG